MQMPFSEEEIKKHLEYLQGKEENEDENQICLYQVVESLQKTEENIEKLSLNCWKYVSNKISAPDKDFTPSL